MGFEIIGRQQLKEWLYARRFSKRPKRNTIQRPLNNEEIEYFLKICDILNKAINFLPKVDDIHKKIDPYVFYYNISSLGRVISLFVSRSFDSFFA